MNEQLNNNTLTELAADNLQRFTAILNLTTMALDLIPAGEQTKRATGLLTEAAHQSLDGKEAITATGLSW